MGGQQVHIGAGDMFVAHPNQVHTWLPNDHPAFRQFWMGIRLEQFGPTGRVLAELLKTRNCQAISQCTDVESVMRGLVRRALSRKPGLKPVTAAYLELFAQLVLAHLQPTEDAPPNIPRRLYSYEVEKTLRYLEKNVRRRVTLEELSRVSGFAAPHICRVFHREVGLAPASFQLGQRLEKAKEALLGVNATIAGVARDHGFASSQHFSTRFLRYFGQTPRQWQKHQSGWTRAEERHEAAPQ